MNNKTRIIVDTNVFIKAIFHKDENSKALLRLKEQNKVSFVLNKEMQNELLITFIEILDNTLSKSEFKRKSRILTLLLSTSMWQVEEIDHKTHTSHCEDIDDNKFIDCAIDGNVKYIISYDTHLNSISDFLKEKYNIEVLSPLQFYMKYEFEKL